MLSGLLLSFDRMSISFNGGKDCEYASPSIVHFSTSHPLPYPSTIILTASQAPSSCTFTWPYFTEDYHPRNEHLHQPPPQPTLHPIPPTTPAHLHRQPTPPSPTPIPSSEHPTPSPLSTLPSPPPSPRSKSSSSTARGSITWICTPSARHQRAMRWRAWTRRAGMG